MEGGRPWKERAPLERGALSLQTSLSPENFPQEHPPLYGENLFRYVWAGALGESFLFLGRYFSMVRLRARLAGEVRLDIVPKQSISSKLQARPAHKTSAKPHFAKTLYLPKRKKLPPNPRRFQKAKQIFASKAAGIWGKFGEVEGGLEGEGTPSERGFLLPPRSFQPPTFSKTAPERNGRGGRGARGERK